ncbi:PREDICTED: uncharacterized protein LOC108551818 isoform X3 [Eufriesea mexicana]|uniref:uncharacterized protein LOC108551818 isoform X3 n=1 Tax=Eufriesea mexicana TaxID=516756 RepID=UPI00083C27D9|nr:PREDICTED: uncharacterized protein LOC108551818 isoform X3 [Eufriesea mexicana]
MTQVSQHAKFRYMTFLRRYMCLIRIDYGTENLTCRFIQLRKENGKLFTGRKYSAQAGWEYILQQMREEFPTIMANVHYRVLKKKWSNLLQQYKELKNPVHGDRNKANDVSWPFYNAIDEVLGYDRGTTPINDEYIDPHEFLCVSVTPEEPTSSVNALPAQSDPEIEHRTNDSFPEQRQMVRNSARRKRYTKNALMSQLPRATELTIEKVTSEADCSKDLFRLRASDVASNRDKERAARNEDEERPRKSQRSLLIPYRDDHETQTDRRIEQIFEYIKRRDEENRSIMVRVMHAVESIANKL